MAFEVMILKYINNEFQDLLNAFAHPNIDTSVKAFDQILIQDGK